MSNQKSKILLIEDEQSLSSVLEVKLIRAGFDVQIAVDGEEGMKMILDWKPDLILLDIVMPKIDGYEVLEKLNEQNIKTPVIIISNSGQLAEIEKTKKLGAVDCLIKAEFDPTELIMKINNYLSANHNAAPKKTAEAKPIVGNLEVKSLGVNVLLVEDEVFLRDLCGRKLANDGFTVYTAVDGEEALSLIDEIKPDIILLDIILPAIDGFEVLSKVRAHSDPKIKAAPVIMLSNLGQEDDVNKAMGMGATSYIIKANFSTDEISQKVKETLKIS